MKNGIFVLGLTIAIALAACDGGGTGNDAGAPDTDAGDGAVPLDAPTGRDAGRRDDAALEPDGGMEPDGGTEPDGGMGGCSTSADCDDGDMCNGAERCEAGACVGGTPPICDDSRACTMDSCEPATGCRHVAADADGDGADACSDCDDADASIRPGAPERCNMLDDDCDLVTDEGVSGLWYSDCDEDTFASFDAVSTDSCGPPALDPGCAGGGGNWTMSAPTETRFDCADNDARAHTGAMTYQTTPIPDQIPELDFDFDCDGFEELQHGAMGACTPSAGGCAYTPGWVAAVPDCGETGAFVTGCGAAPACAPAVASRVQGCR